jgi:3-keto-5-aminohexanoate cleavage enzyme
MDKLIVTVTCDASISYPATPTNPTPKGMDVVVDEYVRSVNAGASICHLHGPFKARGSFEEAGAQEVDLDVAGWLTMRENIMDKSPGRPIIQYGYAHAPFDQRLVLLEQNPDMVSVNFAPHDECFNYDEPERKRIDLYAIHDRDELTEYGRFTLEHGIKPEVESFQYGSIWNAQELMGKGLLKTPVWTTFFLGWRGGTWTPPTLKAMQYMHDHLPEGFIFNTSVMDPPMQWQILTMAILLGGHVRVGMEDSPYLVPGQYAKSNAELVEKIVRIARELGREIASPDEARSMMGMA